MKQLKPCKAPGTDGLPVEFYKRFWNVLGDDFLDVINEVYLKGQLSYTQSMGHIKLIYRRVREIIYKTGDNYTA